MKNPKQTSLSIFIHVAFHSKYRFSTEPHYHKVYTENQSRPITEQYEMYSQSFKTRQKIRPLYFNILLILNKTPFISLIMASYWHQQPEDNIPNTKGLNSAKDMRLIRNQPEIIL